MRDVREPGAPLPAPEVPVQMIEKSYGLPFRTYISEFGPAGQSVHTYARRHARPGGAFLNVAVAVVLGIVILVWVGRVERRPEG